MTVPSPTWNDLCAEVPGETLEWDLPMDRVIFSDGTLALSGLEMVQGNGLELLKARAAKRREEG